jgi:hypothetical protein
MKKAPLFFIGIAFSLQALAQNNKVTSANMHLTEFATHRDSTELLAAKDAIDAAAIYDKTKDEPKMYLYRGEVYNTLFGFRLGNLVSKALAAGNKNVSKVTADAYTKIDTTILCIAANSFIKVLQLAPKDYYSDEAKQSANLPTCLVYLENKSFREFNEQHYPVSLALAQKLLTIFNIENQTDSTYKETVEMAANSADKTGNSALAITYYQKLIDVKFGDAFPYNAIANIYFKQKDSTKGFDIIEKGRAQFPNDIQLIITETNIYLGRHDFEKAENNLTLSINKLEQSTDKEKNKNLLASLYTNLGGIYDHKANPRDAKGVDLAKPADYDDLLIKAETNYKKALDITPNDFDLLYNTGALYFNQAIPLAKQANDLPLNATEKYNKLMDQAKADFLKAQPYFEKAYGINPNDAANTNALIQVYGSTNQTDKAEAIRNKK